MRNREWAGYATVSLMLMLGACANAPAPQKPFDEAAYYRQMDEIRARRDYLSGKTTSVPSAYTAVALPKPPDDQSHNDRNDSGGRGSASNLLLFGGEKQEVFLGCLNCSKYDAKSVLNEYGPHGSKYSSESIFNQYGSYGGAYSSLSACSKYSTNPPVIVDAAGGFYGRLSANEYVAGRSTNSIINRWLSTVCAQS